MGIAALNITEGISHQTKTAIMKFLLLTVFVAVAYATEEAAEEAKPEAPKAVVPVHPYYGLLGHQLQRPGVRLPGFSGTCWGCRGKRSADAETGYYGYPYGFYGYPYYHAVKPLKAGTAVHPGLATSFVETSGAAGK